MDLDNFNLIAWNIRGGVGVRGRRRVKDLIQNFHPSLFAICETHCKFERVANFWQQQGYELIHEVEAMGHRGGLWVLATTNRTFAVTFLEAWEQTLSVAITTAGRRWVCTAIYASPNPNKRIELWAHLIELRQRVNDPWLALGDWNEICSLSEVVGGDFSATRASNMLNMLEACNFIDLGFMGPRFTWERRVNGRRTMAKRLDRALGDMPWRMLFAEAYVEHLARVYSDHSPLLLRLYAPSGDRESRPFSVPRGISVSSLI